jgi:hypothetical protein
MLSHGFPAPNQRVYFLFFNFTSSRNINAAHNLREVNRLFGHYFTSYNRYALYLPAPIKKELVIDL